MNRETDSEISEKQKIDTMKMIEIKKTSLREDRILLVFGLNGEVVENQVSIAITVSERRNS